MEIDHAVFINIRGERFVSEDQRRDVMAEATLVQPEKVLLWVADDRCKKRYGEKKTERILRDNLIFRADTIEALADMLKGKFHVPPDKFLKSIMTYNKYAKMGKDPEFGKKRQILSPSKNRLFGQAPRR